MVGVLLSQDRIKLYSPLAWSLTREGKSILVQQISNDHATHATLRKRVGRPQMVKLTDTELVELPPDATEKHVVPIPMLPRLALRKLHVKESGKTARA